MNAREKEFIEASQNLREAEIRKAKRARTVHWDPAHRGDRTQRVCSVGLVRCHPERR